MQYLRPGGYDIKNDARMAPRQPVDDGSDEAGGAGQCIPDPHLPDRAIIVGERALRGIVAAAPGPVSG